MTDRLNIARGLALDADYIAGGTTAVLAKKGAGKSYLGRVMAEEFWRAKVPQVHLDPMGAMWGLRSSADGESEGIPITIFGGEHGDVALERNAGKVLADLVVDERLSMVIDMSQLGTRAAERQFAHDFLDRLYRRNRDLVHLVVDEADLFAPQKPQAGDQPLLGVTENIVRRGRNKGIGITLMTQRPAVLNKDVLTQIDALVAMRMVGKPDLDAINEWFKAHSEDPEKAAGVRQTLSSLENGECWWWVPELGILDRVKVRHSRTFDSSPTRRRDTARKPPKSFADVDLSAVEGRIADTIERQKAEDPRELRKRIAKLESEVTRLERAPTEKIEVPVEVPVVPEFVQSRILDLQALAVPLVKQATTLLDELERLRYDAEEVVAEIDRGDHRVLDPPAPRPEHRSVASPKPPAAERNGDAPALKKGAHQMVVELASYFPGTMTRRQLATTLGIKSKGTTFSSYLSNVRTAGLLVEDDDRLTVNQAAFDYLGESPPAPKTPAELLAMWREKLKKGAREMLDALVDAHPDGIARPELAEQLEINPSGTTFSSYLSNLRTNELIEERGSVIYVSPDLVGGG